MYLLVKYKKNQENPRCLKKPRKNTRPQKNPRTQDLYRKTQDLGRKPKEWQRWSSFIWSTDAYFQRKWWPLRHCQYYCSASGLQRGCEGAATAPGIQPGGHPTTEFSLKKCRSLST